MASTSEVILPIGTQKHDPAWKHCLMIRSGGRTKLKCVYCSKLFLGGGIHRIKEHLARQKGNASCCPRVPTEVQDAMLHSLEGAAARKRKKLKLADELNKLHPTASSHPDHETDDSALQAIPINNVLDFSGTVSAEVREENAVKAPEKVRKRRGRKRASPQLLPPLVTAGEVTVPPLKSTSGSAVGKELVFMAIGRFLYEAGVPLDSVNSVYFQPMIDAISSAAPGLESQQLKVKAFDPISIDNMDTVDDWVVEKSGPLSGATDYPNWMDVNQPINNVVSPVNSSDEEIEAFFSGLDEEMIQAAAQYTADDDSIKEDDENPPFE
ncbi:hypothetical protein ACMD2_19826 [Ananas comosus]|uniref:BED-type domain-containing protein n=1 Tax=Ananas comosus TaxID=4615 RepID=A0A199VF85_ANACO|nr:hypothetical protein ACMD2_19826 [Ananas comosus]